MKIECLNCILSINFKWLQSAATTKRISISQSPFGAAYVDMYIVYYDECLSPFLKYYEPIKHQENSIYGQSTILSILT
mgnify:CR=1 FL=1